MLFVILVVALPGLYQIAPALVSWGAVAALGVGGLLFLAGLVGWGRCSGVYDYEPITLAGCLLTGGQARQLLFTLGLLGGGLSAVGCLAVSLFPVWNSPAPSPTAQPPRTPAATRTPLLTATQDALNRQATATHAAATRYFTTTQMAQWPVIFADHFDQTTSKWWTGQYEDKFGEYRVVITNGVYRFEMQSREGFYWLEVPKHSAPGDFSLTVDARQTAGSPRHDFGVVFGLKDDRTFYYFAVDNTQWFTLWQVTNGEWASVVDWQAAPALHAEGFNRLTVNVSGKSIDLFINDQPVARYAAATPLRGKAGVIFNLYGPDKQAVFEFDNFEVRAPPAAP